MYKFAFDTTEASEEIKALAAAEKDTVALLRHVDLNACMVIDTICLYFSTMYNLHNMLDIMFLKKMSLIYNVCMLMCNISLNVY